MNPRVLVIDDNIELAENLVEILEDEGFDCNLAGSGKEALAHLEGREFQVVITDLKMEGMSGLDVLRAVSARWPQIPVLIMTAYAKDRTVETARREGALDVVRKPLDIGSLLSQVHRLLAGGGSVLIVEDDDDLRENELEVLSVCPGIEVRGAATVQEALQACEAARPDVVVIDLRLPDGSGVELADELHRRFGDRSPTMLFASAYPDEMAKTLRDFASDPAQSEVLQKPFSPAQLVSLIRRVM